MSLADELANGETFTGWRFGPADGRRLGLRRAGFRGSAAFFALLLAAASGSAAEDTGEPGLRASEAHSADGASSGVTADVNAPAAPAASIVTAVAGQPGAASKFSRRRMLFSLPR